MKKKQKNINNTCLHFLQYKSRFNKLLYKKMNTEGRTNINKPGCTEAHSFSQLKYICLKPECLPQCFVCSLCIQESHNGPHHHTIDFEDFKSNIIPQLSANAIYGNTEFLSDLKQSRERLLKKLSEVQAQMFHLIKRIRLAINNQFDTIIKSYNQETYKSELAQLEKQVTSKKVINICYAVQIIKRNQFNNKNENIIKAENQYDKLLSELGDSFTQMIIQSQTLKYVGQLKSPNKYRIRDNFNEISPKTNSYMMSEQSRQQSKKGYGQRQKKQRKMKKTRKQNPISLITEDEGQESQPEAERSREKKKLKSPTKRVSSQNKNKKNDLIINQSEWKPISNNQVINKQKQNLHLQNQAFKKGQLIGNEQKKIDRGGEGIDQEEKNLEETKIISKETIQNNQIGKGEFNANNQKNKLTVTQMERSGSKNEMTHSRWQTDPVKNKQQHKKPLDCLKTPPNLKNNKKIVEAQIECPQKKYHNQIRPKTNPKTMSQQQIEKWFYENYKENQVYTIVLSQKVRGNKTEYLWFHNGKFQWNDKEYLKNVDEWPRLKQYMEYIQRNWN